MRAETPSLAIRALLSGLDAVGIDPGEILREGGIDIPPLDDPFESAPAFVLEKLWKGAFVRCLDPTLPARVGLSIPLYEAGLYDHLTETGATFRDGMYMAERYYRLISHTGVYRTTYASSAWIWVVDHSPPPVRYTIEQCSLAALYTRSRQMYPHFAPQEIYLSLPDTEEAVRRCADLWDVPVRLGRRYSGMRIPTWTWELPNPKSNPYLQATLRRIVDGAEIRSMDSNPGISSVRRLLFEAFDRGIVSAAGVADEANISLRSLQRQLNTEHVTFRDMLDIYRRERAFLIMQSGEHNMSEVAHLLGYSGEAPFNRAFHRWTGLSPTEWMRFDVGPKV